MKTIKHILLNKSLAVILLVSMVVLACGKDGEVSPDEGYYTCSMHPNVIRQKPGDCPICFMKLTFVEKAGKKKAVNGDGHKDDEHAHIADDVQKANRPAAQDKKQSAHFRFSLAKKLLSNANIHAVPVTSEKFEQIKTYSGHVDYNEDPNRLAIINTKYDGWIEKLFVSKEGQWVSKGKPLMAVYSQKILAAKEEHIATYKSIKQQYEAEGKTGNAFTADPILKASRRKLLNLDVSRGQINRLERTLKAGRLTYYRSPISGLIIKKNVLRGSYIKPGMELFRVADLRKLWIYIHIFENDISLIKKGLPVTVYSKAYPGATFKGTIDLIYPFFDMKKRDVKVRIIVPNPHRKLRPGMFVNVNVAAGIPGRVLTIPDLSVIYSGEKNYVFVSLGGGEFEVRPVSVTTTSGGKAVIAHGLKENEMVVSNGQFLLDSEASLKEALQKNDMTN